MFELIRMHTQIVDFREYETEEVVATFDNEEAARVYIQESQRKSFSSEMSYYQESLLYNCACAEIRQKEEVPHNPKMRVRNKGERKMAKKVGEKATTEQVFFETNSVKKLARALELVDQEEIASQKIWFRMEEMRNIVEKTDGAILDKYGKIAIDKLRKLSGQVKGIVCTWYDPKDVHVLLSVVGE